MSYRLRAPHPGLVEQFGIRGERATVVVDVLIALQSECDREHFDESCGGLPGVGQRQGKEEAVR